MKINYEVGKYLLLSGRVADTLAGSELYSGFLKYVCIWGGSGVLGPPPIPLLDSPLLGRGDEPRKGIPRGGDGGRRLPLLSFSISGEDGIIGGVCGCSGGVTAAVADGGRSSDGGESVGSKGS